MGVATVPSSAARGPFGLSTRFSARASPSKRVIVLAFKADKSKNIALVSPKESTTLPVQTSKEKQKKLRRVKKPPERVQALAAAEAPSCSLDLDYYEAAAKLENIYKLSPPTVVPETEVKDHQVKRSRQRRKKIVDGEEKTENEAADKVVRSQRKMLERLSLQKRIELKNNKAVDIFASHRKKKPSKDTEDEKINRLVREYSVSTDLVSLDWKKMKIPPVLPSSEHIWLFKLMQPMKAILPVKENVQNDLGREPTDGELAVAMNMSVVQLRKHLEVGRAARNKLIKTGIDRSIVDTIKEIDNRADAHNLRLVLFVMNKYFQELTNGPKFQDFCQAGVKGLITGIDRFEPGRSFRLSTYGLFWIRHAIMRFMTLSSFTKVSFGLESVRLELKRAKMELLLELQRLPTEDEIVKRVGISPERFNEVKKASRSVYSLHARHATTQEEFINGITDLDGGGDKRKQPALLRLALDDVLDSLKPKESLVIRQRYGLDGRGDRTLGEIAGNLNISREMVRKHEVKALLKLKHPARVDYLRRYIV